MKNLVRGFVLLSASVSVLTLAACGGGAGNANVSNVAEANRVDAILDRAAREARASGNKTETVALLEQIYMRNEDDPAIATSFGQALREDEQLNRARQVLYPFTEGKNAYTDAVVELAMVQLALGQYKEAELTSRRAVELDPKQGRSYLALGTALDAQNYHEQAEVAFRKGIDLWKGDPAPIMNNLALNLAAQNKLDQAIDMLKKAQEISPGRVEIERNMRIITTLKEGADDFIIKKEQEKKAAAAPAPKKDVVAVKKEAVPVEEKQLEKKPAAKKAEPVKTAPKKETVVKKTTVTKEVIVVEEKPQSIRKNSAVKPTKQNFKGSND